jgi:arsenate reductase
VSALKVLFVCGRNAVRSPMAEALYNQRAGGGASSCGVIPAGFPDGHMAAVMKEVGLDLLDFECRGLEAVADKPARVICLTPDVVGPVREMAVGWGVPMACWEIPDPAFEGGTREVRLNAYRAARDAISREVDALLPQDSEAWNKANTR